MESKQPDLHPLGLHGYKLKETRQKSHYLVLDLCHTCSKCSRASLPCKSSKHGFPRDYILEGHIVKHSPSILNAPTFGKHVHKAIPHNDIWLTTTLNDLLMSMPALLKCHYIGTCIEHPKKVTWFGRKPCHCTSSNIFCHCLHFTYPNFRAFQETKFHEAILLSSLSKHPQCSHTWHICQHGYLQQRHQTHSHFELSAREHLQVQLHWHGH